MARDEFLAQAIGSLLQCKPPIIEHVSVVGFAHRARDIVEMGVLVGVEADHFRKRQQQPECEHRDGGRLPAPPIFSEPVHPP